MFSSRENSVEDVWNLCLRESNEVWEKVDYNGVYRDERCVGCVG